MQIQIKKIGGTKLNFLGSKVLFWGVQREPIIGLWDKRTIVNRFFPFHSHTTIVVGHSFSCMSAIKYNKKNQLNIIFFRDFES